MKTLYFETNQYVRRQGNVIDLNEYRERMQRAEHARNAVGDDRRVRLALRGAPPRPGKAEGQRENQNAGPASGSRRRPAPQSWARRAQSGRLGGALRRPRHAGAGSHRMAPVPALSSPLISRTPAAILDPGGFPLWNGCSEGKSSKLCPRSLLQQKKQAAACFPSQNCLHL